MFTVPAERGTPSTLPTNKCQLGVVSKYSHHFFPDAPTLYSHSHSSGNPPLPVQEGSLSLPQACLATPSPALLFHFSKASYVPGPGIAQHFLLYVSYKKSPSAEEGLLGVFWGGLLVCVWGFPVFGLCLCHIPPAADFSLHCPSPRKSAILQFVVSLRYNFPATTSEILGANMCWRLFRDLNLTETKPRLSYKLQNYSSVFRVKMLGGIFSSSLQLVFRLQNISSYLEATFCSFESSLNSLSSTAQKTEVF